MIIICPFWMDCYPAVTVCYRAFSCSFPLTDFFLSLVSRCLQWSLAVWYGGSLAGGCLPNRILLPQHSKWLREGGPTRPPIAWWAVIWTRPAVQQTMWNQCRFVWKESESKSKEMRFILTFSFVHVGRPASEMTKDWPHNCWKELSCVEEDDGEWGFWQGLPKNCHNSTSNPLI